MLNIFTDRVRSTREGYVLTRVCPSVHTGGGDPSQVQVGGGYPCQVQPWIPPLVRAGGGYPDRGYPTSGTPLLDLAKGVP